MDQIVKRNVPPPIVITDRMAPIPQLNRVMSDPTGEKLAAKIARVEPGRELEVIATIRTRVVWSREIITKSYAGRDADGSPKWREESQGWFASFEGSFESLYMGRTDPGLKAGEVIYIPISRVVA